MTPVSASGLSGCDGPPTHADTAHRAALPVVPPRHRRATQAASALRTPTLLIVQRRAWSLLGIDVPRRSRVPGSNVEQRREPTRAALALRATLVHTARAWRCARLGARDHTVHGTMSSLGVRELPRRSRATRNNEDGLPP